MVMTRSRDLIASEKIIHDHITESADENVHIPHEWHGGQWHGAVIAACEDVVEHSLLRDQFVDEERERR